MPGSHTRTAGLGEPPSGILTLARREKPLPRGRSKGPHQESEENCPGRNAEGFSPDAPGRRPQFRAWWGHSPVFFPSELLAGSMCRGPRPVLNSDVARKTPHKTTL